MPKKENPEVTAETPSIPTLHEHGKQALKYHRNKWGLINDLDYKFNKDGSINWEGMIPVKYIVLNKDKKTTIESKYKRNFDELQNAIQDGSVNTEDIENQFKLILLAGYKEVAKIRGFTQVRYSNNSTSPDYVAVNCEIQWIPNYETHDREVRFSSLADAHLGNTKSFATMFLNTIAENRAFVRAVRNFLNIHVVGFDEVGGANPIEENQSAGAESNFSPIDPRFVLKTRFEELTNEFKNVTFEIFKKYLVDKKNIEEANSWKTINDVPKDKAYDILGYVKEQQEKLRAKKKE